ncbi:hypothetical protein [Desulfitobacterium hafniense]|nr:hypothetical protein [Desulfitobacterium hafniense]
MSTVAVLDAVKEFLEEKVANTIKLQKANDNNVYSYELVNPAVHLGWVPPKGFLPQGMESGIPCLIVGIDDASKDIEKRDFNIRISAATFSPGLHKQDRYTPDFHGYQDLLNLIDRTLECLEKYALIGQRVSIKEDSIRWGMYEDQPYPYWYGWITFTVSRPVLPPVEIVQKYL